MDSTDNNAPDPELPDEDGEEFVPLHPPGGEDAPPKPAVKTPGLSPTPTPVPAGGNRRAPLVTPPAGLPAQGPVRPSGSVPAGQAEGRTSGSVAAGQAAGRRSGTNPASNTPAGGAPVPQPAAPQGPQPSAGTTVAGTMEAIQLLISLRSAANKVKQLTVVDQISHGLQNLGIKMPDSKGQLPAMKTPTHAVPAQAFVAVLVHVLDEAKKAKQFSLAERVRSGLEGLGYRIQEGPSGSQVGKRVKP